MTTNVKLVKKHVIKHKAVGAHVFLYLLGVAPTGGSSAGNTSSRWGSGRNGSDPKILSPASDHSFPSEPEAALLRNGPTFLQANGLLEKVAGRSIDRANNSPTNALISQ